MFRDAWDRHRSNAKEEASRLRTRMRQIDTEVNSLLDRVARTQHEETARAYEKRIAELRSETAMLEGKLSDQGPSDGDFEKMFELSMKFLSSPWGLWENGTYELKRTVLRLAFTAPIRVCRKRGFEPEKPPYPSRRCSFSLPLKVYWCPGAAHTGEFKVLPQVSASCIFSVRHCE